MKTVLIGGPWDGHVRNVASERGLAMAEGEYEIRAYIDHERRERRWCGLWRDWPEHPWPRHWPTVTDAEANARLSRLGHEQMEGA